VSLPIWINVCGCLKLLFIESFIVVEVLFSSVFPGLLLCELGKDRLESIDVSERK
jgi:hypothetical protein